MCGACKLVETLQAEFCWDFTVFRGMSREAICGAMLRGRQEDQFRQVRKLQGNRAATV